MVRESSPTVALILDSLGHCLLHGGFGAVGVPSLCNGDLQREQNSRDQTLQASPIRGNDISQHALVRQELANIASSDDITGESL